MWPFDWVEDKTGFSVSNVFNIVKDVLVKLVEWVWEKIKKWVTAHWEKALILVLGVIVLVLVKALFVVSGLRQMFQGLPDLAPQKVSRKSS